MSRKTSSVVLLFLLLISALVVAYKSRPASAGSVTVSVPGTAGQNPPPDSWADSGISLSSGDTVSITATGRVSWDGGYDWAGPDGDPSWPSSSGFENPILPGAPVGALIAKIGDGPIFLVGSGPTPANGEGELIFAVNDENGSNYNNVGNFTVTIVMSVPTCVVTFTESGLRLPDGANWVVTLNGPDVDEPLSSSTNKTVFNVPPNVYTFSVTPIAGYTISPASGSITVNGAGIVEFVTFSPVVSLKGISSTITGATSLVANTNFTFQQNFYLYTGNKDAQNPEVYWCQNCMEMNLTAGKGIYSRASMFIWSCYWEGNDIYVDKSNPFDECPNYWVNIPGDSMVFKSYIGTDNKLHMENDIAWFSWVSNKLVLTSSAYIACEFISTTWNIVAPNFVIVGPAGGGQADFSSGSGTVTCETTTNIGGTWQTALNLAIVGFHQSTGESSTGLMFFTAQGQPAGGFGYQSGAQDQGIFFGIDPDGHSTQAPMVSSLGNPPKTLVVTAQCPVYLDLFDELGNCVGYNATSGTVDIQIDNGVWISNQTLLVFDPSGTYHLDVTGSGNGTYEQEVFWQGTTGPTITVLDFNSTITENETQAYVVGAEANVAPINIVSSKTVVGQGFGMQVNATVADLGGPNATSDVSLYANGTLIGTQSVLNVSGWNSTTACFTWNTTGIAYGNYTLWATTANNNNCTGGMVTVSIPGDITGSKGVSDGKVDMRDIAVIARCFGSNPGDINWNPNADINGDGTVNMRDIALVARQFGNHV
ncbi:MAG: LecA/PA-IL family lectin [Candidatus Bathyarchaeia archaeon]